MVRGEVSVTCPGCGFYTRMPTSALQRDNHYCSRCGKQIPLGGVKTEPNEDSSRPRPKSAGAVIVQLDADNRRSRFESIE